MRISEIFLMLAVIFAILTASTSAFEHNVRLDRSLPVHSPPSHLSAPGVFPSAEVQNLPSSQLAAVVGHARRAFALLARSGQFAAVPVGARIAAAVPAGLQHADAGARARSPVRRR